MLSYFTIIGSNMGSLICIIFHLLFFFQLFDQIWNKIGASVELSLLRLVSGDRVNLTVTVDEPTSIISIHG